MCRKIVFVVCVSQKVCTTCLCHRHKFRHFYGKQYSLEIQENNSIDVSYVEDLEAAAS